MLHLDGSWDYELVPPCFVVTVPVLQVGREWLRDEWITLHSCSLKQARKDHKQRTDSRRHRLVQIRRDYPSRWMAHLRLRCNSNRKVSLLTCWSWEGHSKEMHHGYQERHPEKSCLQWKKCGFGSSQKQEITSFAKRKQCQIWRRKNGCPMCRETQQKRLIFGTFKTETRREHH